MTNATTDLMHLLTTTEVANELKVSGEAVRNLYHTGKLRIAVQTKLGPLFDKATVARLRRVREQNGR